MDSDRKTAIIVGILFLTATITFGTGATLLDSILGDSDYLTEASENENKVVIAALLIFIDGVAIVLIAIMMLPILKKEDERMALGYLSFRIAEFGIILVYLISPLLLIDLSQEYTTASIPKDSSFATMGSILLAIRYWTLLIIYLFNGIAGLIFVYLLYQARLIPRSLSILGLFGYALLIPGPMLDMLGHIDMNEGMGLLLLLPGGLFELLLPIWLFVKGFTTQEIEL